MGDQHIPRSQYSSFPLPLDRGSVPVRADGPKTNQDNHHNIDLELQRTRQYEKVYARSSTEKCSKCSCSPSSNAESSSRSWTQKLSSWSPSEDTIHNAIMGTSDGMTVPFAVTASLAGVTNARLVVLAGLAELIAGAISMAAGGVLGAKSDKERHDAQIRYLTNLVLTEPNDALAEFQSSLSETALPPHIVAAMAAYYNSLPSADAKAQMIKRFEAESIPTTADSWKAGLTFFLTYFAGLLSLLPYIVVPNNAVDKAFKWSIGITAVLSFLFGALKTHYNNRTPGVAWYRTLNGPAFLRAIWGGWVMCGLIAAAAVIGVVIIKAVNGTL